MRSAALMAVIVLSGMVQVDVADQSFTLTGGSGRVYAEEGEGAPLVVGQVKAVDASEDTITLAGRKKEGREVVPDQTYAVTAEAAKELGNVKVGNQVTLTLSSDKQSVVRIAVRQPRRDGEGEGAGKPRLRNTGGTFGGTDGDSITILGKGDYKVASDAKIVIETDEDEEYTYRDEEGEHVGTRPKMVEAQLSEFKEKQRVTLRINEEGEAVYVHGHRPKKKRGEGDG